MNLEPKEIIKSSLLQAFDKNIEVTTLQEYFSKDYEQYVDDEYINYNDFIAHITKVREVIKKMEIEFLQLIQEGNIVFSRHKVTSTMQDDTINIFIVFAEFHIDDNNKISKYIETTRLISGDKNNSNLGSTK